MHDSDFTELPMMFINVEFEEEMRQEELLYRREAIQVFLRDGWDMIEIKQQVNSPFLKWSVIIDEGLVCEGENVRMINCMEHAEIAYTAFITSLPSIHGAPNFKAF